MTDDELRETIRTGIDRFGSRLGTRGAKINAVLTREYKTPAQIQKESGVRGGVYDHLEILHRAGLVEKTKDGTYRVAEAPKSGK